METPSQPLYFDNNATTAVDPRVVQAMLPTFTDNFGNPNSEHAYGWRASAAIQKARELVAALIGAHSTEIEFTSGASASIRRALLDTESGHVITCVTEHAATLDACIDRPDVTFLKVDSEGSITTEQILEALKPNTKLVSLAHGNNEIGTLHPIREIGGALRAIRPDVLFHVDAAQTAGKHEIDVEKMHIDLLSLSAHKFHGPKGVGALYRRSTPGRRVHLREHHHGTPNVPGIVGLGAACEIAKLEMARDRDHMTKLRDLIIETLTAIPQITLNGPRTERLCSNVNLTLEDIEPAMLLKDIAFSSASACTGATQSHVLKAIGLRTDNPLLSVVRFGLSRFTTEEEVSALLKRFRALTADPASYAKS